MERIGKKIVLFCLFFVFLGGIKLSSREEPSGSSIKIQKIDTDSLLNSYYKEASKYLKAGDFITSETYFSRAIDLLKNIENQDPKLSYRIYANYGVLNKRLGKMRKSLKYYALSEEYVVAGYGKEDKRVAALNINQGNIYSQLGDVLKAKKYYNKALFVMNQSPKTNKHWLGKLYNNLGIISHKLGQENEALDYYLKTLAIKLKSSGSDIVSTYVNIANCYKKLGNIKKAEEYYKLSISETIDNMGDDYYQLADHYMNYAVFLSDYCHNQSAIQYLEKARVIYLKNFGAKHPDTAHCLQNIGDYYFKNRNNNKSLFFYQQSLVAGLDHFDDTNAYVNPGLKELDPQLSLLNVLKHKAFVLYKLSSKRGVELKDLKMSLSTYDLCLSLIDRIRIAYQDDQSKYILSKNEKETYTQSIEIALLLFQKTGELLYKEKAFRYSERSKAASLMASIRDISAKDFGGIPVSLQEKEKDVKRSIARFRELVYEERKRVNPNRDKINKWQNELFNLNGEYEQMVLTFEKQYPDYYALKYDTHTIDVKELQSKLTEQEVFVEYSLSDSALFSFVISSTDFHILRHPLEKDNFNRDIESVRNCLKNSDFSNETFKYYQQYTQAAFKLYDQLLLPIDSLIHQKRLIVVPDDKLAYIPFGVLLTEKPDTSRINYRDLKYLLKDHSVTYQNSATMGFSPHKNKQLSSKVLLAFAPSYENVNDSILYTQRAYRDKLFPLPGVKKEVRNISKVMKSDLYVDNLATERNFKKLATDYDVLHLAMHTIIDDKNPMFSKLVFTQDSDIVDDGLLNTFEIYNMNFNARMVVLSACNTGDGKLQKGEGVMSLARGFFYAGCPSIIMTLWTVEDQTGSSLMTHFYNYLSNGLSKDEALREAKLTYLESADPLKAHPYFWSGYVTMGDVSPLYETELAVFFKWFIGILLIVVVVLLLVFFRLRRRSSQRSC